VSPKVSFSALRNQVLHKQGLGVTTKRYLELTTPVTTCPSTKAVASPRTPSLARHPRPHPQRAPSSRNDREPFPRTLPTCSTARSPPPRNAKQRSRRGKDTTRGRCSDSTPLLSSSKKNTLPIGKSIASKVRNHTSKSNTRMCTANEPEWLR